MGFVTIRDVAQRAGVSITAVSQILHNKGRFSKKTRDMVLEIVDELGYIPDSRAQAIRATDSKMVGLLVPDLRNRYFADLVSSMEGILYEDGYNTFIGTSAENVKRQDAFIENILGQRIDGVIIVPQGMESSGLQTLVERKLPLVFVDRRVPDMGTVPYVVSDPAPGLEDALQTLRRYGHRRIAYASHSLPGSFSLDEREQAFRKLSPKYFGATGAIVESFDGSKRSLGSGLTAIQRFGATAVIFGYSPDAISCLGLFQEKKIGVGTQMSVVSFDDIDVFNLMNPRISIISQQADHMGRKGVEILLDLIHGGVSNEGEMLRIPTIFKRRESVGPVPGHGVNVS